MSKKHFDKGRSHGGSTCSNCGEELSAKQITHSIHDGNMTHHFDEEGEHVRTDVHAYGSDTHEPGSYCYGCSEKDVKADRYSEPGDDRGYYNPDSRSYEY